MAGSYEHVTTRQGNLVSNERFVDMVENLGDAYEMAEEMYGMIWWLAATAALEREMSEAAFARETRLRVARAQKSYRDGLAISRHMNRRRT